MATRTASIVSEELASRARGLEQYVRRMDELHIDREISDVDIRRIYAGAMMNFYSAVERSIERLFMGLLMRRFQSSDPLVRPLVEIDSEAVARAVVRGDRFYVDWLPYNRFTRRRAESFFSRGLPFTQLSRKDGKNFDRVNVIRNAIAHDSSHAKRRFYEQFIDGKPLPPDQRSPAGYLRGRHRETQTRLQFEFSQVAGLMRRICR